MNSWDETIGQTIDLIQDGKDIFSNQYVILALTFAAFFYIKTSTAAYWLDVT